MLQVNHIHLSYGPRVVLDDVSCTGAPGEKAGLIGVNGAGKSSLLKIIAGIQEPDRGNVILPRSHGYLSQDVANETSVAEGITVRDYIFSSTGLDAAIRSFEELSLQLAGAEGDRLSSLLQRFEQAQGALDRLGYFDADARRTGACRNQPGRGHPGSAGEHTERRSEDQADAGTPALPIARFALTRRADELPGRGGDGLADGLVGSLSWRLAHHLARPGFARSRHQQGPAPQRVYAQARRVSRHLFQLPHSHGRRPGVARAHESAAGTRNLPPAQNIAEAARLRCNPRQPAYRCFAQAGEVGRT